MTALERPPQIAVPVELLIVSSPGGHLFEMLALRSVWCQRSRVWVTLDAEDTRSILRDESVIFAHAPTTRNASSLMKNLVLAFRLLRELRPNAVFSTGAGLSVAFGWAARALAIPSFYLECGGRVDEPSLSCRLIAPFADRIYVQSRELVPQVRNARFAGRVPVPSLPLLSSIDREPPTEDNGVFVTVGANTRYPFDRLLRAADSLADTQPVRVQYGISRLAPKAAQGVAFLTFDELVDAVSTASAVVTHAGIGSVMLALAAGKQPIVMPRRRRYRESVDDHQVGFAHQLAADGLALVVEDANQVRAAVAAAQTQGAAIPAPAEPSRLAEELRQLFHSPMELAAPLLEVGADPSTV